MTRSGELPSGLIDDLACPRDGEALSVSPDGLRCVRCTETYPVVQGIPVLLVDGLEPTLPDVFSITREAVRTGRSPGPGDSSSFVEDWIVRTNGNLYRKLTLPLARYPIASFPLEPQRPGDRVLDVGGNWGRWALGAARRGFGQVIVVDPNLGAALVGQELARRLDLDVRYVVGDARSLPLREGAVDVAFSYSVLQHFSKADTRLAMSEIGRVLRVDGRALVQMPNILGLRQATNRIRQRGARRANPFRVRYWTPRQLMDLGRAIGPTTLAVDGYFSLNPRPEDRDILSTGAARVVTVSEQLKRVSRIQGLRWLRAFADSLWVHSHHP